MKGVAMKFWLCVCWFLLCTDLSADASFAERLVAAAKTQIGVTVSYDPSYQQIAYPNGDVPIERGVCTDVVIRAYRQLGFDLQQLVHEDMRGHFSSYPKNWGLKKPDRNIDHRRVPNLQVYFTRFGKALGVSEVADDYLPGDIVTWRLPSGVPHVGIVADEKTWWTGRPKIIHNIGSGTAVDDMLFLFTITGHYRYQPKLVR
jgi:uncharacterized protein